MKLKYGLIRLTLTATLAMGMLPAHADDPPQPAYVVYDTGTLGGTFAFGSGVNELGWIAGASTNAAGALHAALWSRNP